MDKLVEEAAVTVDGARNLGDDGIQGRPTVSFRDFITWLGHAHKVNNPQTLSEVSPLDLFAWLDQTSISQEELTKELSEFCGIPHVARIEEADVEFKTLSRPFCEAKLVVPVKSTGSRQAVVLSNPFDWETLEDLERSIPRGRHLALILATPRTLTAVLGLSKDESQESSESETIPAVDEAAETESAPKRAARAYDPEQDPGKRHPVAKLAVELLSRALEEEATHLRIEPRGEGVVVKATVGGRIHDFKALSLETGKMLVARFKALAGLDLAKKRTPQSGQLDVRLQGRGIKLRLSTAPDSSFENLGIRVLDPTAPAGPLDGLGLTPGQRNLLKEMASKKEGLVLFVGPLGSGKTTTIYSLLAEVADRGRAVVTVEDPIEHHIPFATQQEVGPEAGRRVLLQRAVKAVPDVLFLSEIRGLVSAQTCAAFTKAGHLTLASMNSSNAGTAVFRLDRLGVNRANVADVLIGVVAQRILDRLCPDCKEIGPLTTEELALLSPFTDELPETVARPVGCSHCRGTGYLGQEGVFEVISIGPRMSDLIREGRPIAELRDHAAARGDLLVGDHGIQKVREHLFPVKDVFMKVLLEEGALVSSEMESIEDADALVPEAEFGVSEELGTEMGLAAGTMARAEAADPGLGAGSGDGFDGASSPGPVDQTTILVVEDEEGTRYLVEQILSKAGYKVLVAEDGGEALLMLGTGLIDLIVSDIHMPNLDGLKLLEILHQHDIDTPVILLTGEPSPDVEARGWEMGVADYLRKPVQRDTLLDRILGVLEGPVD